MSIRLRVKGPQGQTKTLSSENETLSDFLTRMKETFDSQSSLELLSGYPPQLCTAQDTDQVCTILKSGDSVTLRVATILAPPLPKSSTTLADIRLGDMVSYSHTPGAVDIVQIIDIHPGPPAIPESYTAVVQSSSHVDRIGRELNIAYMSNKLSLFPPPSSLDTDLPPVPTSSSSPVPAISMWACVACTFLNTAGNEACAVCETRRSDSCATTNTSGPPSISNSISATRHCIPDDNSCLFHAAIFLLNLTEIPQNLRHIIASTVRGDSDQWSDAMLGKPREEYIRYISDSTKWGGQVELNILSSLACVEIAAVDVQSGRVDVYGQGSGHDMRVYMLFTGVHFDAVIFDRNGHSSKQVRADDMAAERSVLVLAASLRNEGAFTDQQTMLLVCQTCGWEMRGDYEARLHAGGSGHTDFKMKKSH